MLKVISKFESTVIVPADSSGPYTVNAGSPVTLIAANTHPDATYEWDLGDGATANTASVTHTYADNGVYVAKLKVVVHQPGGATSRHFAIVNARNVPPVVQAGPDRTVNEGDIVSFTGTFTDVEYPDTHEASWDWGDYQKADVGVITETNNPPSAQGVVTGTHAWGDNGSYTVTLTVRDDDGGVGKDTLTVTVLNVPPTVDAGPDLFAYPCTVLTLTAKFTDPGWLDTHIGGWEFGDCTPQQPAVIREKNDPPKGEGVAIASHTYRQCGTYPAVCTVIDDDGGVGQDTAIIRVVDVRNKGFEDGFRERAAGAVANEWEAYRADIPVFGGKPPQQYEPSGAGQVFFAEEYPVHGGQRSQHIRFEGFTRFGIRQQVGANENWDYQVTAWYSLAESSEGVARLGLDPAGGTDATAATVVWAEGSNRRDWNQLTVRATAPKSGFITIFLEGQGVSRTGSVAGRAEVFFDDVCLAAVQPFCPEAKEPAPRPEPEQPTETCVNFYDLKPQTQLPPVFERQKFIFEATDKQPQLIVPWGLPTGKSKLRLRSGLRIHLPFPASSIRLKVYEPSSATITAIGLNEAGATVSSAQSTPQNAVQTLELSGSGIVEVMLRGGSGEAVLIEVCATPDTT
jgi:PKD repeat protein